MYKTIILCVISNFLDSKLSEVSAIEGFRIVNFLKERVIARKKKRFGKFIEKFFSRD